MWASRKTTECAASEAAARKADCNLDASSLDVVVVAAKVESVLMDSSAVVVAAGCPARS